MNTSTMDSSLAVMDAIAPSQLEVRTHPYAGTACSEEDGPDASEIWRFGENDRFCMALAVSAEQRERCWRIVYDEYVTQGYAKPDRLGMRYTLHDALPDTGTFLVSEQGRDAGTVSVYPDSPLGLPADDSFREEIDILRDGGRQPVEVGRLTIRREHTNERCVLTAMFDILSLYSRCILQATDLVITVNPSHAKFYERMLLFERIGEEKEMGCVCGAPAVPMRLDLALQKDVIRWAKGEGPEPARKLGKTFYKHFSTRAEELQKVARLKACLSVPDKAFLKRYFVQQQPLIPSLPSGQRCFFERCYPQYDLARF